MASKHLMIWGAFLLIYLVESVQSQNDPCTGPCEPDNCRGDPCSCTCKHKNGASSMFVSAHLPEGPLEVGDFAFLNCSGVVGFYDARTKLETRWKFRWSQHAPWNPFEDFVSITTKDPTKVDPCQHLSYWTKIRIDNLTLKHNGAQFDCYLVKDGRECKQYVGKYVKKHLVVKAKIYPASYATMTITPHNLSLTYGPRSSTPLRFACQATWSRHPTELTLGFRRVEEIRCHRTLASTRRPSLQQGNFSYFINYTIKDASCMDAGVYCCQAKTERPDQRDVSTGVEKQIHVTVLPFRTSMVMSAATQNGTFLNCTSLVTEYSHAKKTKFCWEYSSIDSASNQQSKWKSVVNPKTRGLLSISHSAELFNNCSTVVRSQLSIWSTNDELYGIFLRCYVEFEGASYEQYASTFFVEEQIIEEIPQAALSITPRHAELRGNETVPVIIACRGRKGRKKLGKLTLSYARNGSEPTVELAYTTKTTEQLYYHVVNKIRNRDFFLSGGIAERFINYTLVHAGCLDAGKYTCTSVTESGNATESSIDEMELRVSALCYAAVIRQSETADGKVRLACNALMDPDIHMQDYFWVWEYTLHWPIRENGWIPLNSNADGVGERTRVATNTTDRCFVLFFSTFTLYAPAAEQYEKTYRCYITDRTISHMDKAGILQIVPPESIQRSQGPSMFPWSWVGTFMSCTGVCFFLMAVAVVRKQQQQGKDLLQVPPTHRCSEVRTQSAEQPGDVTIPVPNLTNPWQSTEQPLRVVAPSYGAGPQQGMNARSPLPPSTSNSSPVSSDPGEGSSSASPSPYEGSTLSSTEPSQMTVTSDEGINKDMQFHAPGFFHG